MDNRKNREMQRVEHEGADAEVLKRRLDDWVLQGIQSRIQSKTNR